MNVPLPWRRISTCAATSSATAARTVDTLMFICFASCVSLGNAVPGAHSAAAMRPASNRCT
jgi:hypothetical protein